MEISDRGLEHADDGVEVRIARMDDADAVARIYEHYVLETIITFEETTVPADEMARRMAEVRASGLPWLVAERDGRVVGYAYAAPWKTRAAYRFSTEVAVYVAPEGRARGVGTRLYATLLPELASRGVHAVMGGIALPNESSVRLHQKFGFQKVAHFEEVGFKMGRWVDVGYWQLVLSAVSGDRSR
jgi:phosphinothricin acetyltransferase